MSIEKLKLTKKQITEFIANSDLFSHLTKHSIQELSKGFEVSYLAGNQALFKQNDPSDSLYVLMYGLLCVIKENGDGKDTKITEIIAGSVVGEIGCIYNENRNASIYAIRDSILLKMSKKTLDNLAKKHPEIIMAINRESIKRLANPGKYMPNRLCTYFSLIPAGNHHEILFFAEKLSKKLAKYGNTLVLSYEKFTEIYGSRFASASLQSTKVLSFFHELETKYRYIIFVANSRKHWTEHCIRQADRILLIAKYNSNPMLNEIETLIPNDKNIIHPSTDLVILFDEKDKSPENVRFWLEERKVADHYNIRHTKEADIERLARIISGNALGLVLSGGGSLALAHAGVIKALKEAKIPIDYVGGSSMGGLVAALVAMEIDSDLMAEMLENSLLKFQDHLDYTLPVVAFIRAKLLDKLLKEAFGEYTRIENLWINYFSVSTNLNTNEIYVHDKGLLWQSIRASISLPGILPVVFNEKKQILVDGSILNNLPVDIMQNKINNGKILASSVKNAQPPPLNISYDEYTSSGWHLLLKYLLFPKFKQKKYDKKIKYINIASIIQSAMIIGSNNHQNEMTKLADYNIIMSLRNYSMINFHPIRKIIRAGYKEACEVIGKLDIK